MPRARRWEPELTRLVPRSCKGVFLNEDGLVDLEFFRETLGKAAKYILPAKFFDYTGPVYGRRFMDAAFLEHDAVQSMVISFRGWTAAAANENPEFAKCLKDLANYSRGLDQVKRRRALRKKRLERLRHDYIRLLRLRHAAHRLTDRDRELVRGVTYFLLSLKSQFLSKRSGQ